MCTRSVEAVAGEPYALAAQPLRDSAFHYGGRMAFLADGTLLLTSGEGFEYRAKAQFLDNHFGKIIRINADGSIDHLYSLAGTPLLSVFFAVRTASHIRSDFGRCPVWLQATTLHHAPPTIALLLPLLAPQRT